MTAALLLLPFVFGGASGAKVDMAFRGVPQDVYYIPSKANQRRSVKILFIPGDGGWRGAAVSMAQTIAGWGYDVYGLDTKKYLTGFTNGDSRLSVDDIASDMAQLARQLGGGQPRVVIVGWSQGASMAVLAAARPESCRYLKGIVTLGLPEYGVLGWTWRDTLAVAARREPNQPKFYAKDFLPHTAVPMFAIFGTNDDYTAPAAEQAMLGMTRGPKQLHMIEGANHRFDGHQDELNRTLAEALSWVQRD
jgi:pimeloyl-ACP methyl ester carboxylesterase